MRRRNRKTAMVAVREADGTGKNANIFLSGSRTFSVLGEGRTVQAKAGSFTDDFDRYAVHIYLEQ